VALAEEINFGDLGFLSGGHALLAFCLLFGCLFKGT
jgi:hypothetical protein